MNKYLYLYLLICTCCAFTLVSCADDSNEESGRPLTYNEHDALIARAAGYHSLFATRLDGGNETLRLTCDATWLILMGDTLPQDGILEFKVEANNEVSRRAAHVTVSSAQGDFEPLIITITQKGEGDDNDNSQDDALSDYRVGWGFNAYLEFKNINSIKSKIIDSEKMQTFDHDTTFLSVQEVVRALESFSTCTAYSLVEMSSKLTREQNSTSGFLGVRKTTKRYSEVCTHDLSEQCYGYARLQKVVASRSLDAGAIKYLIATCSLDEMPFTEEFREAYRNVASSHGTNKEAVKNMLNEFGTHLVISSSAGGSMDYVVSFDRHESSNILTTVEQNCKHIFGRETKSYSGDKQVSSSSNIHNSSTFEIAGGSPDAVSALRNTIAGMTAMDQLSATQIQTWLASINYTNLSDPAKRSWLSIIDYSFIPIWELFSDAATSAAVENEVMDMARWSSNVIPLEQLGGDNFSLNTSADKQVKFNTSADATLVKIIRDPQDHQPVLEVCNEYVPKVRTDKRITVYYPIYNGCTRLGQGLFPGDGEGNQPCYLTFSDGDCYVNPIDGYGCNDIVSEVYYLHGNLYVQNYGLNCLPVTASPEEQFFALSGYSVKYPIVKIGAGYWTRSNMSNLMDFGFYDEWNDFYSSEVLDNNTLYANVYDTNDPLILYNNKEVYGPTVNDEGRRTLWYVPLVDDKTNLTTYVGRNLKAMFKGQPSGFEADFKGYFGYPSDESWDAEHYDEGALCYVPFKSSLNGASGTVLILTPQYTWREVVPKEVRRCYYPVRLFRTNFFIYK